MTQPLRLIFLDVDGVLNNRESIAKPGLHTVHGPCVEHLSRLCEATGALCVLSSTWRLVWPLPAFEAFLRDHGFTGRVVDRTPHLPDHERGMEIAAYLEQCRSRGYPAEAFVILDDDADMGPLLPFLVQTSTFEGLTEEAVDKATRVLTSA